MAHPDRFDFIVIGAGIAGASLAWRLAAQGRTLVIEREDQPGYHTTGRSAAHYIASYGPPVVRALTIASRPFFDQPPEGFADQPLIRWRPVMMFGEPGEEGLIDEHWAMLQQMEIQSERLDPARACARVPVLRPEKVAAAVMELDAFDMDVDVIHQGFLRGLRRRGGVLVTRADLQEARAIDGGWEVVTSAGRWRGQVVINAAGAWCDEVGARFGARPIGIIPKRRTAIIFDPPEGLPIDDWPVTSAINESFYFKPEAGRLLGTPANQDPTHPQDVQPEELDIALAVHRIEEATTMTVRPRRTWAGLRSFVADGEMVGGFDADVPGLFWCAGQGGYGIQSAPGMSAYCAAILTGEPLPAAITRWGVTADSLSPARLQG